MRYHELTELLKNNRETKESFPWKERDKIIRDWLRDKIDSLGKSFVATNRDRDELLKHFGITKQSCECGACKFEDDYWVWCSNKNVLMHNMNFCPNCGSKLGDL